VSRLEVSLSEYVTRYYEILAQGLIYSYDLEREFCIVFCHSNLALAIVIRGK